jgi:hypothetical protein
MSADTSWRGRFQFSVENAKRVRMSIPTSTAPEIVSRTALAVPEVTRQAALGGPAPVAVHDHGDVAGQIAVEAYAVEAVRGHRRAAMAS